MSMSLEAILYFYIALVKVEGAIIPPMIEFVPFVHGLIAVGQGINQWEITSIILQDLQQCP